MMTFIVLPILILFLIIANWKMFEKAGKNGWECIVPIYGYYVLTEIADLNWWWFLLAISDSIIEILGIESLSFLANLISLFANFNIYYNIAKKFKKENKIAILSGIFSFIFILIFGYSKNEVYDKDIVVSKNGIFKINKSTQEKRRTKNNTFIKSMGIACYENLPMIESSSDVVLKDLDTICKRAIACLLSTQLACDIQAKQNYEQSKEMFSKLLKEYGVEDYLLESEKKIFNNTYNKQDVRNVVWTYECYWSLIWALGLINDDEIKIPNNICDCEKAIALVSKCKSFEEFKNKTRIRNIEEILDMLDLYYRYHWACVEKRINPNTSIGFLDSDVVLERRKGLEWLISNVYDWNSISLDT